MFILFHRIGVQDVLLVRKALIKRDTREEPLQTGLGKSELKEIFREFETKQIEKMKQITESQLLKFDDFNNERTILDNLVKRLVLDWTQFDQLCLFRMNWQTAAWFSNPICSQQFVANSTCRLNKSQI